MKFTSDFTFPSWPGKSVNPNFRQYQSHRNNDKFNCCLQIQSKTDARIPIYTPHPLTLPSNHIHISCPFPVVARKTRQPPLFPISILQNNYKFTCSFKCHKNMIVIISITTHSTF